MNIMTTQSQKESHLALESTDDDFDIPLKQPTSTEIEKKEELVVSIMAGVDWLWRHANISDLYDKNTPKKEKARAEYVVEDLLKGKNDNPITNGYNRTIVLPSAYYRNGDEDSISLFQIVENLKCNKINDLQSEADIFFLFLPREQRGISASDRPVALIKDLLLKKITPHNVANIFPMGIEKSPKIEDREGYNPIDRRTEFLACHWDIHLTANNLAKENLELLYGILASSSMAFRNNNPNGKIFERVRKNN